MGVVKVILSLKLKGRGLLDLFIASLVSIIYVLDCRQHDDDGTVMVTDEG